MPTKKPTHKPITLNDEQQAVVEFQNGFAAVYAGPGSGKSLAITQRYARLIKDGNDPNSTISLSFTSTAAKNLRERVEAQVGKIELTRTAGAVTFHSLALQFSQKERDRGQVAAADADPADFTVDGGTAIAIERYNC